MSDEPDTWSQALNNLCSGWSSVKPGSSCAIGILGMVMDDGTMGFSMAHYANPFMAANLLAMAIEIMLKKHDAGEADLGDQELLFRELFAVFENSARRASNIKVN